MRQGDNALVLKPLLPGKQGTRSPQAMLDEAVGLANAINVHIVDAQCANVKTPSAAHLFGSGWVDQVAERVKAESIALVIVDHALSPIQQRNLERDWNAKVIDRTGLILEIFGARARTREGKLQVELAALNYQRSRLVRSWTHLERQRGGFGFLGGPGESQLEMDRRLIDQRILKIKGELEDVRRTRGLQRTARERAELPTLALVGYTNAGKSTLFNRLTQADVMAKDMLFATLDPTMRGLKLPSGREVILSDTVGFIADLPTQLIEAFRATLEEVQQAAVILHVRDIAHPDTRAQQQDVETVLQSLKVENNDPRLIEVLNKADLLPEADRALLAEESVRQSDDARLAGIDLADVKHHGKGGIAVVSALDGMGIATLLERIEAALGQGEQVIKVSIPLGDGAALAWLHAHGRILAREDKVGKAQLEIVLSNADFGRFTSRFIEKD